METSCIRYNCSRKLLNIIVALAILLLFSLSLNIVGFDPISKDSENEIYAILYFLGASGTFLLCSIAWVQLKSIERELEGTFFIELTRISNDPLFFEGESILFSIISNDKYKKSNEKEKYLSDELEQLKEKGDIKYLKIVKFFNYLETMGYLYNKKYITIDDFYKIKGTIISGYNTILNKEVLNVFSEGNTRTMLLFKKLADDLEKYKIEKES